MTSTLGRKAARGAAATMAGQFVKFAVQIATVVLLARLLAPEDYGLMALTLVVIGLAEVLRDFGLSAAAVQAKTLSTAQRDNLLWINVTIGLVLATVVLCLSGLLAELYDAPQVASITRAMAVIFLINGTATQYRASLSRALRFKAIAIADSAGAIVALAAAVAVALAGGGVWALVTQQIVQAAVVLVLLMAAGRWLPGRPRRHTELRRLLVFGANRMSAQMLEYLSRSVDTLVIGIRAGAVELGYYSRAYSIVRVPTTQLINPASSVALPVLSRLQDDNRRFDSYLVRGQTFVVTGMALAMGFLIAQAGPLVDVLLGPQWAPSVPYLVLLAIGAVVQIGSAAPLWALTARGHAGALLRLTVITKAVMIALILLGAIWGTMGVAVGFTVSAVLGWLIGLIFGRRVAGVPAAELAAAVLVVLAGIGLSALASFGVGLVLPADDELLRIGVGAVTMLLALGAVWLVWPAFRSRIRGVLGILVLLRGNGRTPVSALAPTGPTPEREG